MEDPGKVRPGTAAGTPRFGCQTDGSPEAERVRLDILRRMTPAERFELTMETCRWVRSFTVAGIRMRDPDATPARIDREYARIVLPEHLFRRLHRDGETEETEPGQR